MNNPVARRALLALSHPLSIAALLVLLLNDHWWKHVAPSWLTGKLSDVAGLVFAPFVLLVLLALVLPARCRKHERDLGLLALFIVGSAFALIKTIPPVRDGAVQLFQAIFGWRIIILIDPTDLLALPALLVAWHIWERSATTTMTPKRSWALLALSAVALVATSGPYPNLGVYCLQRTETGITAYSSSGVFISEDGGDVWRLADTSDRIPGACTPFRAAPWELTEPGSLVKRYRIVSNESIERSTDGGKTWETEFVPTMTEAQMIYYRQIRPEIVPLKGVPVTEPGPYDAVFDPQTGNLIIAMGQEGVAVRAPSGHWRYVSIGPYARVELNHFDTLLPALRWELLTSAVLLFLVLATLVRWNSRSWRTLFVLIAWVFWTGRLIVMPHESFTIFGLDLAAWLGLILPAVVALPLGIIDAAQILAISRRAFRQLMVLAFGSVALFLTPYWLWSQDNIPQYRTATFFALGLVIILVLAGRQMIDVSLTRSASTPSVADK